MIRAGVMMANIIWYAMNTNSGMLPLPKGEGVVSVTPARNALSRFPMMPPSPPLKQRE